MGIDPWPFLDRLLLWIIYVRGNSSPKKSLVLFGWEEYGKRFFPTRTPTRTPTNISIEHGHRRVDLPIYYERGNGVVNHYEPF